MESKRRKPKMGKASQDDRQYTILTACNGLLASGRRLSFLLFFNALSEFTTAIEGSTLTRPVGVKHVAIVNEASVAKPKHLLFVCFQCSSSFFRSVPVVLLQRVYDCAPSKP